MILSIFLGHMEDSWKSAKEDALRTSPQLGENSVKKQRKNLPEWENCRTFARKFY